MDLFHQTFKFLGHTSTTKDIYSTVGSTTYAQDYSTYKIEINYISFKVNAEGCLEYSLLYLNARCWHFQLCYQPWNKQEHKYLRKQMKSIL